MSIPRRALGSTGVEVSALGYGAMELRGAPRARIDDADAGRLLNAVLDGGIDLIDTSIDYGRSEELIGRFLADRRDEYFLASKCGCMLDLPTTRRRPTRTTGAPPTCAPASSRACAGCAPTGSTSCRCTSRRRASRWTPTARSRR